MQKPNLKLIKECLPFVDENKAKQTVTYLIEYIESLDKQKDDGDIEK